MINIYEPHFPPIKFRDALISWMRKTDIIYADVSFICPPYSSLTSNKKDFGLCTHLWLCIHSYKKWQRFGYSFITCNYEFKTANYNYSENLIIGIEKELNVLVPWLFSQGFSYFFSFIQYTLKSISPNFMIRCHLHLYNFLSYCFYNFIFNIIPSDV